MHAKTDSRDLAYPTLADLRRNAVWCVVAWLAAAIVVPALRFWYSRAVGESLSDFYAAVDGLKYLLPLGGLLALGFAQPSTRRGALEAVPDSDELESQVLERLYRDQGKQYDPDSANRDRRVQLLWYSRAVVALIFVAMLLMAFRNFLP